MKFLPDCRPSLPVRRLGGQRGAVGSPNMDFLLVPRRDRPAEPGRGLSAIPVGSQHAPAEARPPRLLIPPASFLDGASRPVPVFSL